jgi:hypothetical protein
LHKCASTYLQKKFQQLAPQIGLWPIDVHGYEFRSGRKLDITLQPRGFFYGPYRAPLAIRWPEDAAGDFKMFLVVRDPRDILTSLFYSVAYSHSAPKAQKTRTQLDQSRARARQVGIDEFVREAAGEYRARFALYWQLVETHQAYVTRYEDLVTEPDRWLDRLLDFLEADVPVRVRRHLIRPADFAVKGENPNAHIRQVQPGDHARKLRSETIDWLNDQFRDVLTAFGYRLV